MITAYKGKELDTLHILCIISDTKMREAYDTLSHLSSCSSAQRRLSLHKVNRFQMLLVFIFHLDV